MDYIERTFVSIPEVASMISGTHNAVMAIGHNAYLEVIAIDPTRRHRRIHAGSGSAISFLKTSSRINRCCHILSCGHPISRQVSLVDKLDAAQIGNLHAASVISTGRSRLTPRCCQRGCLPALIEWQAAAGARMSFMGLTLEKLRLCHPDPARLQQCLKAWGQIPFCRWAD